MFLGSGTAQLPPIAQEHRAGAFFTTQIYFTKAQLQKTTGAVMVKESCLDLQQLS